jgi:enamine deaminase RidA (YjgF/YER057c/UK114 family)
VVEVRLTFDNVESVLAAAGVEGGWSAVYSVRSYHVGLEKTAELFTKFFKERAPHRPVWTCVPVPELALPEMVIEVEVEALVKGGSVSKL